MNTVSPSAVKAETPAKGGTVFVSYRRSDTSGYAGRISKELAKTFRKVFWDRKGIAPGADFSVAIRNAISASSVLLVIIGPEWLQTKDAAGRMRLSMPEDYVRFEIQAAIEQGLKVVPVLVGGAKMPAPEDLPDGLSDLAKFQALELTDSRWEYDLASLVKVIRPIVDPWFRFRQFCMAIAAIAIVACAAIAISRLIDNRRVQQKIAVLGFESVGGNAETASAADSLARTLLTELQAPPPVPTTSQELVEQAMRAAELKSIDSFSPETLQKLKRNLNSPWLLVVGSLDFEANNAIYLNLKLQNTNDGSILRAWRLPGTTDRIDDLASRAAAAIRNELHFPQIDAQTLEQVFATNPENTIARTNYQNGLDGLKRDDLPLAQQSLEQAIKADPDFAPAHDALSRTLFLQGYYEKARAQAEIAQSHSKTLPSFWQTMIAANSAEVHEEWANAIQQYQDALKWQPGDLELLLRQALATAKAGQIEKALAILKGLQAGDSPESQDPRISLYEAEIYQMSGNAASQQEATANRAAKQANTRGEYLTLGRALSLACDAQLQQGRSKDALQTCEDAKKYSEKAHDVQGQVRATNLKANILAEGDPGSALKNYQEALATAQRGGLLLDEYGALNNLGLKLADKGDQESAATNFKRAGEGFEELGQFGEASGAYSNLGSVYFDQGQFDEALPYFQKALELALQGKNQGYEAQARLNLGLIRQQNGSLDGAQKDLAAALRLYQALNRRSDVAFVNNALGDIYLQQMRYADAGKAYAEADHISGEVGEAGNQAFSRACLVNLDLEEGKLPVTGLLDRIEDAIQQAGKSNDAYSQSFARIIKARLLLQANKVAEAGREAQSAVDLAQEDKQATNKVSAQIILAETKARSGEVAEALAELDRLKALTDHERNVGQNLEAQLTYLKVMKQAGQLQQRKDAAILLSEFQKDAQEKGYKLLAAKAQSIMHGKP